MDDNMGTTLQGTIGVNSRVLVQGVCCPPRGGYKGGQGTVFGRQRGNTFFRTLTGTCGTPRLYTGGRGRGQGRVTYRCYRCVTMCAPVRDSRVGRDRTNQNYHNGGAIGDVGLGVTKTARGLLTGLPRQQTRRRGVGRSYMLPRVGVVSYSFCGGEEGRTGGHGTSRDNNGTNTRGTLLVTLLVGHGTGHYKVGHRNGCQRGGVGHVLGWDNTTRVPHYRGTNMGRDRCRNRRL